jgi:hypothetical protein
VIRVFPYRTKWTPRDEWAFVGDPPFKRCYGLIGYREEGLVEAERRLERIFELGFLPFSQLYQPEERAYYSSGWITLNKTYCRPDAIFSSHGVKSSPEACCEMGVGG